MVDINPRRMIKAGISSSVWCCRSKPDVYPPEESSEQIIGAPKPVPRSNSWAWVSRRQAKTSALLEKDLSKLKLVGSDNLVTGKFILGWSWKRKIDKVIEIIYKLWSLRQMK